MDKIDKNKPLPQHTELDYHECYAKTILEDLFPDRFVNLKLCDKPDLRDTQNNIGIEVTIAEDSKTMNSERKYSWLPYVDEYKKEESIKNIKNCGASYENGILFNSGKDNFELINQRIKDKVEKINDGLYATLAEYQLFVFSSIYVDDMMLNKELNYLLEHKIVEYFKKIYILVPEALFYFDLAEGIYKVLEINFDKQCKQAQTARQMVEKGESYDRI